MLNSFVCSNWFWRLTKKNWFWKKFHIDFFFDTKFHIDFSIRNNGLMAPMGSEFLWLCICYFFYYRCRMVGVFSFYKLVHIDPKKKLVQWVHILYIFIVLMHMIKQWHSQRLYIYYVGPKKLFIYVYSFICVFYYQ